MTEPACTSGSSSPSPPFLISPPPRRPRLDLAELWEHRDLLLVLALRDLKLRYRQTALGVVWIVLGPLLSAGIYTFVFSRVANLGSDGVPYFLSAYAGSIGYTVFSSTVGKSSGALVTNSALVSKVYFHRLVLPLSTIGSTMLDFSIGMALLGVFMVATGVGGTLALLLLPVWLLLLTGLGLGIGLFAGAFIVRFRDVGVVVGLFLQLLLFASPVAYTSSAVPQAVRHLYALNPMVGVLEAFRWSLFTTRPLSTAHVLWSVVATALFLAVGTYTFRAMERSFADVI